MERFPVFLIEFGRISVAFFSNKLYAIGELIQDAVANILAVNIETTQYHAIIAAHLQ